MSAQGPTPTPLVFEPKGFTPEEIGAFTKICTVIEQNPQFKNVEQLARLLKTCNYDKEQACRFADFKSQYDKFKEIEELKKEKDYHQTAINKLKNSYLVLSQQQENINGAIKESENKQEKTVESFAKRAATAIKSLNPRR